VRGAATAGARVNIYLACTVRGDRGGLLAVRALAALLERHGHTVLTHHLLAGDVDAAESALTEREVFDRDVRWLDSADLLIAEASGSSYGVGFEVGYVLGRSEASRRRVMVLYDASRAAQVSRLITGNTHPACTTYGYRGPADMLAFVESAVEAFT
jgi:nucleoside 2-deoxyribosyltransferase